MKDFFKARRPHNGLTYEAYLSRWQVEKEQVLTKEMSAKERKYVYYLKYNYERQKQVHADYELSPTLAEVVDDISDRQVWMVLTEPWCGDSAYALPVIAEAARHSDRIQLRILLRDDNLDIMDQYLTGTSRSIPKLVAFADDGTELFTWGPRPEGARSLRQELMDREEDSGEIIQKLLDWYEDGGWRQVDEELAECIRAGCMA